MNTRLENGETAAGEPNDGPAGGDPNAGGDDGSAGGPMDGGNDGSTGGPMDTTAGGNPDFHNAMTAMDKLFS